MNLHTLTHSLTLSLYLLSPNYSLTHFHIHAFTHSLTLSLYSLFPITPSLIHIYMPLLTPLLRHSIHSPQSLPHSFTYTRLHLLPYFITLFTLPQSLPHSFTYTRLHSLPYFITRFTLYLLSLVTPSLYHSLTHSHIQAFTQLACS